MYKLTPGKELIMNRIKEKINIWLYKAKLILGPDFEDYFKDDPIEPLKIKEILLLIILFLIPIICTVFSLKITHNVISSMNVDFHKIWETIRR